MDRRANFARAFARQAQSDFETYKKLCEVETVPHCHRLHFLQMACEKVAKAYLCNVGSSDPDDLVGSHKYVENTFRLMTRQFWARSKQRQVQDHGWLIQQIGHVARQIELLAPAVEDGGKRPDNCEYPWEWTKGQGDYVAPVDYTFPNVFAEIDKPAGVFLLKVLLPFAFENLP